MVHCHLEAQELNYNKSVTKLIIISFNPPIAYVTTWLSSVQAQIKVHDTLQALSTHNHHPP